MTFSKYLVRLADNNLILGHRLSEWCGHGPFLEQDMAMTNIALDLIGQSRSLYALAAEVEGKGRSEDDLAFVRLEHEYMNLLLTEIPNGDFAHTVVRQLYYSSFQILQYRALHKKWITSTDKSIQTAGGIIEKAIIELEYHVRWSGEWVIRLGDGTEESHERVQKAVTDLYRYSGEAFEADSLDKAALEQGFGIDLQLLWPEFQQNIRQVIEEATLEMPGQTVMMKGGKEGRHTEYMGYLLAELQYMQRAYPNANW